MGRASSRKKYRAPRGTGSRGKGRKNWPWYVAIVLIVGVGVALIAFSRGDDGAEAARPTVDDHFHASLNVNICGTDIGPAPEFEQAADNANLIAGVHSHGDGLIHTHPNSNAEAGDNATVGLFFRYGGWSVSEDSITAWDDQTHTNGDSCEELDGREGVLRWSLNGEEQDGNVADHVVACGLACGDENDQIVIAFLPEDEEMPAPPEPVAPSDLPTEENPEASVPVPEGAVPDETLPEGTTPPGDGAEPPASPPAS
ncbi:MAG: hypothetical protein R3A49_06585 [Acidimicrobiia bacterium]